MKNSKKLLFVSFLLLILIPVSTFAQEGTSDSDDKPLTKKEIKKITKEWKRKKRRMKPLEFKKMVEDYELRISDLSESNKSLQAKANSNVSKEVELTTSNQDLHKQVLELTDALSACQSQKDSIPKPGTNSKNPPQKTQTNATKGLVFKVQIGAFKKFDIRDYLWNNEGMSGTTDSDLMKYTIGQFRDFETAKNFETDIRRMGLKDAFVVSFKDGKKIAIEEARKMTKK